MCVSISNMQRWGLRKSAQFRGLVCWEVHAMNSCPQAEWHIGHEIEPKKDKEKNVASFRLHASQDAQFRKFILTDLSNEGGLSWNSTNICLVILHALNVQSWGWGMFHERGDKSTKNMLNNCATQWNLCTVKIRSRLQLGWTFATELTSLHLTCTQWWKWHSITRPQGTLGLWVILLLTAKYCPSVENNWCHLFEGQ